MLILRGVKYGGTFCAVGARGFAGEGYFFHKLWKWFGMIWAGTVFAGKTMTLWAREGNMPLKADGTTPKKWFPKCIWASLWNGGEMINQVGLSNRGIVFYLDRQLFRHFREPFMISVMLMEDTKEKRLDELRQILYHLRDRMVVYAPWALQINFACPNTDHDLTELQSEMPELVAFAREVLLDVPIIVNVNALMPTEILIEVSKVADALWIGNAIPFGTRGIDWKRFGVDGNGKPVSPLARRNSAWKGGLSSPDCFYLTLAKLVDVRGAGVKIPIVVGNGIRYERDLQEAKDFGADAVFMGSVAVVRPWRMKRLVNYSNQLFN